MNPLFIREAVEHMLVGLKLIAPEQMMFNVDAIGFLHLRHYNPKSGIADEGWGSLLEPVLMAAYDRINGGVYTPSDSEPPELPEEELSRWEVVFNKIQEYVKDGWIVRFGVSTPANDYAGVIENFFNEGTPVFRKTLLDTLEQAIIEKEKKSLES